MKLLTLAVAAYNMQDLLPKCLDSVTRADVPGTLEVIVVNDGSTDQTLAVARRYEARRPDVVRVVDKDNAHYGSCINAALAQATGKYFRPLDADDWMNTDALVTLLGRLEMSDADLIVTPFTTLRTDGRTPNRPTSRQVTDGMTLDPQRASAQAYGMENLLSMHSMTFRTELLRAIGLRLTEGISYTDTEYCMLPIDRIASASYMNLDLYQYNLTREGQTMQPAVLARQYKPLHQVAMRLTRYYLDRREHNSAEVRADQRIFLRRVLYYFYSSALVYAPETSETQPLLDEIQQEIGRDADLRHDVLSFRIKGIPFVWLWLRLHLNVSPLLAKL